jgi:hypothetical protein
MFPHVIEREGKFHIRRWTPLGFEHWDAEHNDWWSKHPEYWAAFDTADEAKRAFRNSTGKGARFVSWA